MAVAAEQEMTAKIEESRAQLVEAEADIPKAMAEAFRSGKLGIFDYYNRKHGGWKKGGDVNKAKGGKVKFSDTMDGINLELLNKRKKAK